MKKILIALNSEFTNRTFENILFQEKLQVATTTNGKNALEIALQDPPDIILADASLEEMDAFELLDALKENESTEKIPLIVYSKNGSRDHREKAMDYEAKDFVIGLSEAPKNVVLKIKTHLGAQKAYTFNLNSNVEDGLSITQDLGYKGGTKCASCGGDLNLHLIRDLVLGENIFKVSFSCSKCKFRYTRSGE